jgi:hypothetical protein
MTAIYAQQMDALAKEKLSIDLEAKQKKLMLDIEAREKKLALKQKEEKIKEDIFKNLSTIIKAHDPFSMDLDMFLGGVLYVVSEIKNENTKLTSSWKQKGEEEMRRFQNKRRGKVTPSEASNVDQIAA